MSEPSDKIVRAKNPVVANGFTMFWNVVLLNSSLSLGARMTHAALSYYARQSNEAWPGQPKLAGLLGVSERSLRDYLRELEEVKLLTTIRRRHTSNLYMLEDPSEVYMERLISGPAKSADLEAAESAGLEPANIADKEEAVHEEDAGQEEEGTPSGDESPHLPGLAPPSPPKSKKELEFDTREPLVEALWEFHVSVFGAGRVGLTEPRRKSLRGGLKAVNNDLDLCKQAILGLKAYRDSHPDGSKDTTVSVIFETGMNDHRNRTEKIEWWASQAGETTRVDPLAHVPPVHKSLVTEHMVKANRILQGKPMDPDAKIEAEASVAWLFENYSLRGTKREDGGVKWERIAG